MQVLCRRCKLGYDNSVSFLVKILMNSSLKLYSGTICAPLNSGVQKKGMDISHDFRPKVDEVILCCQDMVISTAIHALILATFPGCYIRQVSVAYNTTMTLCHSRPRLIIGAVSSLFCAQRVVKQFTLLKHHYPDVPMVYLYDLSCAVFHPPPGINRISTMSSLEDIVTVFHQALDEPIVEETYHEKYTLSRRQQQVLRLIGEKKRNCEIARELGLHQKTVSSHRKAIRERLGLTRQQEQIFIGELSALMENGNPLPFWDLETLRQSLGRKA